MAIKLFGKTELWITGIALKDVNLSDVASAAAEALGFEEDKVFVVDVRDDYITLDIMQGELSPESFFGKKEELLAALREIEGFETTEHTDIHSDGILGAIAIDKWEAAEAADASGKFSREMAARIARKAIVYPTGFELQAGMIEDTNSAYIKETLEGLGFEVTVGRILGDDVDVITGGLNAAVDDGFGLVITTGGVGAEDKDKTVEALLRLDKDAATPYLVKFEKGSGRHVKDGVRIAVGRVEYSLIVCLPGPNDEVRAALPPMLKGIAMSENKGQISNRIAEALREKYKGKHTRWHCGG